jgi:hypothetical protein
VTATLAAPAVTARTDPHPCPRVEVTVTVQPDTASVTVFRHDATGQATVRGSIRSPVTDPLVITDFETPFGQAVTYTVTAYDAAGIPALPSPPSAPVTVPDPTCPWLADTIDPASARQVTPYDWQLQHHTRESAILWPASGTAAIVIANVRPRATSDLGVITYTPVEAADLVAMLEAPALIWRPPSSWGWPGGHVYADKVDEARYTKKATDARRLFTFTLVPVNAPDATLFRPTSTWRQVAAFYPSWAAVVSAKATWADLVRNPDPGAP